MCKEQGNWPVAHATATPLENVMAPTDSCETRRLPAATRWLVAAAAFTVVVAGMRQAQSILTPVLLAAFLAVIGAVPLAWLARKGLPKWAALLLVLGAGVVIVLTLVALVGTSLDGFASKLPEYQKRLEVQKRDLVDWLAGRGVDLSAPAEQEGMNPQRLLSLAGAAASAVGSLFGDAALILLLFIFMMVEGSMMRSKLSAIWGDAPDRLARVDRVLENVRHYVAIKTWISFLTGVLVAVWLTILGVDYPLLWGLVAFCFNFVPNIGSIIAAVPAVCLALLQIGLPSALYTAVGYIVINNVLGNVVEPRIMGRGLGLSTLVVFLSLVFWGWVSGPVGMFLSVPLTMIAKIALEGSRETKWVGVLLGAGPPRQATAAPD